MNVAGCAHFREALSAHLDREPLGVPGAVVDSHLASCPDCAAWYAAAGRVTRLARVGPAAPIPDLTAKILAAAAPIVPRRRRLVLLVRVALALVGVVEGLLAVPALALGADSLHPPMHVAHEGGAWSLGLAVAFLAAATRPRYAAGLLPLLVAYVAGLVVVTGPDLSMGDVPTSRLADHAPAAVALLLVAVLARVTRQPRVPPRRGRGADEWTIVGDAVPPGSRSSTWDDAPDGPAAAQARASGERVA